MDEKLRIFVFGSIRSGTNWAVSIFAPAVDCVIADSDYGESISNKKYRVLENIYELEDTDRFALKLNEDIFIETGKADKLIETFPESKFILIIRNPLRIIESIHREYADSEPRRSFPKVYRIALEKKISKLEASTMVAANYISQWDKLLERYPDRTLMVKYEDLCDDFEKTFRKMYKHAGIRFKSSYLEEVKKPIKFGRNGLKEQEVPVAMNNDIIASNMKKYGYDIPEYEEFLRPRILEQDDSSNTSKKIYDILYKGGYHNCRKPKDAFGYKIEYVREFVKSLNGNKILDAGCGTGRYIRILIDEGFDPFGIELSSECCDIFLNELPHENSGIIPYCRKEDIPKYDGVICLGVLEHIVPTEINETIFSLSCVSDEALFGIANHSDTHFGIEFHPIQEDSDWWLEKLGKYYSEANLVVEMLRKRFFFIRCKK